MGTFQNHFVRLACLVLALPLLALLLTGLAHSAPATPTSANHRPRLSLETYVPAHEIFQPTGMTHAGDSRLFVTARAGLIYIVQSSGTVRATPFLSITNRVSTAGEGGLLGLAFHPEYDSNGYLYVNYTAQPDGETRIVRFQRSAHDPDLADPDSEVTILNVAQPYDTHNGGDLAFGPDGYLYIGLGDGGSRDDPEDRAQNLGLLLGKMLRIDVDGAEPYRTPPDNPFTSDPAARNEIWAYGLRNPWRFSFDRLTGDMYIGDVGQGLWEEVNWRPATSTGGENYGWNCYEGTHVNTNTWTPQCATLAKVDFPIFDYPHGPGQCAVTGGFVYRGEQYPVLNGWYLFADICADGLWTLRRDESGEWRHFYHPGLTDPPIATFGEDVAGELYIANFNSGEILKIQADYAPVAPLFLPVVTRH